MSNTFSFVGRISRKKENAFVEKTFESGWIINELNFTMICEDNIQYLKASGGMWDEAHASKNEVKTFKYIKDGKDEPITIKWDDRTDPEVVKTIANYRTYTVDTETAENRKTIEDSKDAVAIEKSNKKHKIFITAIDFVRWLNEVTSNPKTKDWLWKVTGEVEYSYSGGRWWRNFVPKRVYHVDSETTPQCVGTITTYFSEGCIDEGENNTLFNVYAQYYDRLCEKNFFTPIMLEISNEHPKANAFKVVYNKAEDEKVREFGVTVTYMNGAQKVDITEDMLSDEHKEMLDIGMVTMDDICREMGDKVYGDRKTATIINDFARGYASGSKETAFEKDDLVKLPTKDEPKEEVDDEIIEDIFDTDDDI